ncbi:hypothetical protein WISP_56187 [Willisornis vidua]|uniref:Uncharacterized protein n=1 Tax=Willisornis vidua TaxID=1566151 RepID=A0ABQ9DC06_9PASS|nr:hypothetical protein WISP_56187 [Willisornis vidua]
MSQSYKRDHLFNYSREDPAVLADMLLTFSAGSALGYQVGSYVTGVLDVLHLLRMGELEKDKGKTDPRQHIHTMLIKRGFSDGPDLDPTCQQQSILPACQVQVYDDINIHGKLKSSHNDINTDKWQVNQKTIELVDNEVKPEPKAADHELFLSCFHPLSNMFTY